MLEGKQKKEYVGSNSSDERLFNFEASSPFSLLVNVLLYARLSGSPSNRNSKLPKIVKTQQIPTHLCNSHGISVKLGCHIDAKRW